MMRNKLRYAKIRERAQRLSWMLAIELNCITKPNVFFMGAEIKAYTQAIEWLGGVVVDDWFDLKPIVEEVQAMPIPSCGSGAGIRERWLEFVNFVIAQAQEDQISFVRCEPKTIEKMTATQFATAYRMLGLDNGLDWGPFRSDSQGFLARLFNSMKRSIE